MEGEGSLVKERANKQVEDECCRIEEKNMLLSLEKGKEEMLREELC